jgi:exosome complex RNA-binding protein Rrp42 (RNase PH superfamily)
MQLLAPLSSQHFSSRQRRLDIESTLLLSWLIYRRIQRADRIDLESLTY